MTPKNNIQMTVSESMEFRRSIIKKMINIAIAYGMGFLFSFIGVAIGFYYKTTFGMERIDERVEVMEKNYVTRDSYNIVLEQQREIKSDLKEIRNLLISQLK